MANSPIFTVIVPTYNRGTLLKRAVDSILVQTFKEFELIIVDDGSTDNTEKIIDSYEDDRIIYIYKENGGINSARNRALINAKGEYIAFCDSDDTWLPEKLEKHLQKYNEDREVKVVYDLTGVIKEINGQKKVVLARNDVCEGWCYKEVLKQGFLTSPTFLSCKRECFDKVGMMPMDLTNCEDDEFCFRLCRHFKVGLVKEILGIYHVDASNRISDKKKLCADDYLRFQEKWSDEILKICGKKILSQRYYMASYKYLEIDDIDTAKKIYQKACDIKGVLMEEIRNRMEKEVLRNSNIIIYGIGDWGKKVYKALRIIGFSNLIFTVTDMLYFPQEIYNVQVKSIKDLCLHTDATIVIASSKYFNEMESIALEKGFIHRVSYREVMNTIFDNEFC